VSKKTTIRKKMSLMDYIYFVNYLHTGEKKMDLSEYNQVALAKVDIRVMRLSKDEKQKLDEFMDERPLGVSVESLLALIPKNKVGE